MCVQLKLDSRQHQHKLKSTASVVRFKSVNAAKLMSSWLKLQLVSKSLQSVGGAELQNVKSLLQGENTKSLILQLLATFTWVYLGAFQLFVANATDMSVETNSVMWRKSY